jgi:hypothetical protein
MLSKFISFDSIALLGADSVRTYCPLPRFISFDNIGKAFLTIFQIITLEEWSTIMYAIQDASSFWVWPYVL